MLSRLVYISNASAFFQESELPDILAVSRNNNARDGLTGLMVFHRGRFFQVLEGEMDNVMACFNRIMRDGRHDRLVMIETGPVEARAFGQWRMAYERVETMPQKLQQAVFSIYDMIPPDSEDRGEDAAVRLRVRDFLASFETLKVSG
ncbi:BLUF domain-containing protein [uncultured Lentibacter sp.]|jgi:hypothetical protein|uniref:BLUF domain-containing protein n=1 Tax=uncultured Lentibacter sp. TaxID=1659309 RepID=UPI002638E565|nr:BLUF domain-containing protein [uncultured Lentibacter sp.]